MNRKTAVARESEASVEQLALMPPVDVIEDDAGITLYADLPGVPKEKLNVQAEGDTLIIEGEMALEMPKEMEATHIEVSSPRYRRVFTLSKELDTAKLTAELKQGVLKLRIQKSERARPRRIEVTAA
ncbi:MAG TPA: Hsp20/alpha crystallin family protein [Burkholderiales bacterium]|jgi:Molecular chaperone (small heat shock protein)